MCKVVGTFYDESKAQEMTEELRGKGFEGRLSLVAKDRSQQGQDYGELGNAPFTGGDSITDGTATGGFIGGLAGIAAGTGALLIPGLGPIIAMGPFAGLLSGALTGGIAGALIDYGIPETEGREYEREIRGGAILAIAETSKDKVEEVAGFMRKHEAADVRTYLKN